MTSPARVRDMSTAPDEIVLEVDVGAPVERTWAAATDWDRQGEWMLGSRVEATARDGRGLGGGLRAVTGFGPFRVVDTMEITGWTPPYGAYVRHTGRVVRGTGAFEVRERAGGSTFVWSEKLDLPLGPLGRLGFRLVRPAVGWGLCRSLRSFAAWAERHPG
ncbi:MAG: SRPBCC family protein [Mycobacteriales bacterium]